MCSLWCGWSDEAGGSGWVGEGEGGRHVGTPAATQPCGSSCLVRDEQVDKERKESLPCIKLHLPAASALNG